MLDRGPIVSRKKPEQPSRQEATSSAVAAVNKRANEENWLEQKSVPHDAIPAGVNASGQKMGRSGVSDPNAYRLYKSHNATMETPVMDRLTGEAYGPFVQNGGGGMKPPVGHDVGKSLLSGLLTASDVTNDANTRIANARRDYTGDGPEEADLYKYYTPNSDEPYTDDDLRGAWLWNGKVLLDDDLEEAGITPDMYPQLKMAYSYFPDGTILEYGDGRPGPAAKSIRKILRGEKGGWTAESPRYPWQDTAGNKPFESGYDITNAVGIKQPLEGLASTADLFLGSAPYFAPGYRYAAAAARSLPALFGYDANTYEPEGRGLEDLGSLGRGRYQIAERTNAQNIAAAIEPWVDAWAEKGISGDVFGGVPKFLTKIPGVEKAIMKHPVLASLFGSALTEAIEEFPASIPGAMSRDSWENLGKKSRWNPETQEYEYDDGTFWERSGNLGNEIVENMTAGGWMGGLMGGVHEAKDALRRRGAPRPRPRPEPSIPDAVHSPVAPTLERRYRNEEW